MEPEKKFDSEMEPYALNPHYHVRFERQFPFESKHGIFGKARRHPRQPLIKERKTDSLQLVSFHYVSELICMCQ
jgi:hypothetical protein